MSKDPHAAERERLLREVERDFAETAHWTGRNAPDPRTEAALWKVRREAFVPRDMAASAFANRPLPIGHGQTISQPFIVAIMTDMLDLGPDERVLEIGTGCGYQTAVLAHLAAEVHSVEVIADLADTARRRLADPGMTNVTIHLGDGWQGLPGHAPFDGIILTAAPPRLPEELAAQLAPGGRMVAPIGPLSGPQYLYRIVKRADGSLDHRAALPVAFVPMVQG